MPHSRFLHAPSTNVSAHFHDRPSTSHPNPGATASCPCENQPFDPIQLRSAAAGAGAGAGSSGGAAASDDGYGCSVGVGCPNHGGYKYPNPKFGESSWQPQYVYLAKEKPGSSSMGWFAAPDTERPYAPCGELALSSVATTESLVRLIKEGTGFVKEQHRHTHNTTSADTEVCKSAEAPMTVAVLQAMQQGLQGGQLAAAGLKALGAHFKSAAKADGCGGRATRFVSTES